jgi:hypothetical protein
MGALSGEHVDGVDGGNDGVPVSCPRKLLAQEPSQLVAIHWGQLVVQVEDVGVGDGDESLSGLIQNDRRNHYPTHFGHHSGSAQSWCYFDLVTPSSPDELQSQ